MWVFVCVKWDNVHYDKGEMIRTVRCATTTCMELSVKRAVNSSLAEFWRCACVCVCVCACVAYNSLPPLSSSDCRRGTNTSTRSVPPAASVASVLTRERTCAWQGTTYGTWTAIRSELSRAFTPVSLLYTATMNLFFVCVCICCENLHLVTRAYQLTL